jgi:biotin-(acetyl-CoA carboxylase) ligase
LENNIEITDLKQLIQQIYSSFYNYLEQEDSQGTEFIYNPWLENAYNLNKEITIISGKNKHQGVFIGIKEGNLLLKDLNNNIISKIITGDVFFSLEKKL